MDTTLTAAPTRPPSALSRWWFTPVPMARIAWLRRLAYAFVWVDVLFTTSWVDHHGAVPAALYQPLRLGRWLSFPAPTETSTALVMWALLVLAAVGALTSRASRAVGAGVAVLYLAWMLIAFSYGKVDHDRFSYLVLLFLLPTVGRATTTDQTPSEAAGWVVRCVQVAAVATYFLSAWAKLRFGGIGWVDSATLLRAVLRRGTDLGDLLARHPWTLHAAQYGILAVELASPVLLAPGRLGRWAWGVAVAFHALVFATVRIIFLPHLVAMMAFLPLERLRRPGVGSDAVVAGTTAGTTGTTGATSTAPS